MQKKVLIIGQGISGTMLSWHLHQAGIDFVVMDNEQPHSSSKVAAGIINPVTGRRVVKVWMDDVVIPFAEKAYQEMGAFLNLNAISKTAIIEFFPNPFMKEAFLKKLSEGLEYISLIDDDIFQYIFNYEFGAGKIEPAFIAQLQPLLQGWRNFLIPQQKLQTETFDFNSLHVTKEKIEYKDIIATEVIFCDGVAGGMNPYFSLLPFAFNKGEALILETEGIDPQYIYKKSLTLVPLEEKNTWWAGSNYLWEFEDDQPTKAFYESAVQQLNHWLKIPFKVVDHRSAVRPATVERRPFAGFHPVHKNVGILNGMGTKGCSLAPYFSLQLTENILHGIPLLKEVDIARFSGILSRSNPV